MKTTKKSVSCPECGKKMEIGFDDIGGDYYAQCRNTKCNFDGLYADTSEQVIEKLTVK